MNKRQKSEEVANRRAAMGHGRGKPRYLSHGSSPFLIMYNLFGSVKRSVAIRFRIGADFFAPSPFWMLSWLGGICSPAWAILLGETATYSLSRTNHKLVDLSIGLHMDWRKSFWSLSKNRKGCVWYAILTLRGSLVDIDYLGGAGIIGGFVLGDALQFLGDIAHPIHLGQNFANIRLAIFFGGLQGN